MGALGSSAASLRISGDALDPSEISHLLGAEPTLAFSKGDVYHFKTGSAVRKSAMWSLDATDRRPGDLDSQIVEIFRRLPDERAIWESLSARFKVDIFVGLFMRSSDEGMSLSPETMKSLGDRGIRLDLCLYGPSEDESP